MKIRAFGPNLFIDVTIQVKPLQQYFLVVLLV